MGSISETEVGILLTFSVYVLHCCFVVIVIIILIWQRKKKTREDNILLLLETNHLGDLWPYRISGGFWHPTSSLPQSLSPLPHIVRQVPEWGKNFKKRTMEILKSHQAVCNLTSQCWTRYEYDMSMQGVSESHCLRLPSSSSWENSEKDNTQST